MRRDTAPVLARAGRRSRSFGVRAVAAVVPVVVLLGGCSGTEAGSAATIGKVTITETTLQNSVNTFLDSLPAATRTTKEADIPQLQTAILSNLVGEAVVHEVATGLGITVSPAQIAAKVAADVQGGGADLESQLADSDLTQADLQDFERTNLEFGAIAAKLPTKGLTTDQINALTLNYVKAAAVKLPVRVSPRYGTWDAANLTLSGGPQSISTPAPTASPSPSVFNGS